MRVSWKSWDYKEPSSSSNFVSAEPDLVKYRNMNGEDDDIINLSDFSCHIYFTESIQYFFNRLLIYALDNK